MHQAAAQDAPITREQARALFDEALALEAAGNYSSAIDKLQQAATYKRTPNIRYNIALCYEKLGKLQQALGEYRIALADAEAESSGSKVAKESRRAIDALEPRIPTIIITLGENSAGATITLDGKDLDVGAAAQGVPVDPGSHVVDAQVAGFAPFHREIDVKEGAHETVDVALEQQKAAPEPAAALPAAQNEAPPAEPETPEPAPSPPGGSTTATVGWIVAGAGVVSLGVSGLFYARRSSAISDLEAACGADRQSCPSSAKDTYDSGKRDTTIANATLGVGVGALVTGLVLVASGHASMSEQARTGTSIGKSLRVTSSPPGTWAGLGLDGRF